MKLTILFNTYAKKKTISSKLLQPGSKFNLFEKSVIEVQEVKEGGHNHWSVQIPNHDGWWFVYKPHCEVDWGNLITLYHFQHCLPHARKQDIYTFYEPFNRALQEFHINTLPRIAAFIAQIAHESGSLRYKEELASGAAYEGRKDLGNINPGDGRRYKGRGLIQLTGRHNYTWASKQLGIDLVNNPQLATQPEISCRIAALYWSSRNLNKYADWNSERGFKIITRKINGGYNGWMDRLNHWKITKKVLHC